LFKNVLASPPSNVPNLLLSEITAGADAKFDGENKSGNGFLTNLAQ
jgi:hypothetical protein